MSASLNVCATLVMLPASLVALARLEVAQLLDDIVVLLARHPRDLVLAGKAAQVAHRAQGFVGLGLAELDLRRVRLEGRGRRLLRRKVVGDVEHVVARQGLGHRRHLRVLRRPSLKSRSCR